MLDRIKGEVQDLFILILLHQLILDWENHLFFHQTMQTLRITPPLTHTVAGVFLSGLSRALFLGHLSAHCQTAHLEIWHWTFQSALPLWNKEGFFFPGLRGSLQKSHLFLFCFSCKNINALIGIFSWDIKSQLHPLIFFFFQSVLTVISSWSGENKWPVQCFTVS